MDKFSLIMVLHSHQPVGNFDHVFEYAVKRCYEPVLEILERYPEFKCGLHYSGPLLDWLEANRPDYLGRVAGLCSRGQVEMLSGGYYEPLLASIPAADAVAQVNRMTEYTRRRFGQNPSGFWLAERIWEPALPAKLAPTGMAYTLVDDTHFYYAGLGPDAMYGYHLTEREGHPLALLPTHKELRYTIPFKEPEETIGFLRRAFDSHGPTCATYGDDSEKFGLWPGTYEWVLEKGWLVRFIEAVLDQGGWLTTSLPGDFVANEPARGRVYPPTASYEEMLTWALPAEASAELEKLIKRLEKEGSYEEMRKFLRGGLWDNFLVKYRESNLMHKRMLFISHKLHAAGGVPEQAWGELYQAQCNCAYWHGLFGGLYLGHLRHAVHTHLIRAEALCDAAEGGQGGLASCRLMDLDLDGLQEAVASAPELDAVIHPAYGGSISVLDLREQAFNLAGALTRRPEAYHHHLEDGAGQGTAAQEGQEVKSIHDQVVFKEEGLEEHLIYDWYERSMFQDHLVPPDTRMQAWVRSQHHEWGDFVNQPYEVLDHGDGKGKAWCRMRRNGSCWAPGGPWPMSVEKTFTLGPGPVLQAAYALEPGPGHPAALWGVELNFSLLSEADPGKRIDLPGGQSLGLDSPQASGPVEGFTLVNRADGFEVRFTLSSPAELWVFPVQTVSQSESGLERTYQGSSLTMLWQAPPPSERADLLITMETARL